MRLPTTCKTYSLHINKEKTTYPEEEILRSSLQEKACQTKSSKVGSTELDRLLVKT